MWAIVFIGLPLSAVYLRKDLPGDASANEHGRTLLRVRLLRTKDPPKIAQDHNQHDPLPRGGHRESIVIRPPRMPPTPPHPFPRTLRFHPS